MEDICFPKIYFADWRKPNSFNHIKNSLKWLETQAVVQQMVWPSHRLSIGIMEPDWDYMERLEQLGLPKSTQELWQVLKDVCNSIPAK